MSCMPLISIMALLWLLSTIATSLRIENMDVVDLKRRMEASTSTYDPIKNFLHYPYKTVGFGTTPYQLRHMTDTQSLSTAEQSLTRNRYDRLLHHKGLPIFPIKDVDVGIVQQGLLDHDRIYSYYRDLESGDLIIDSQRSGAWLRPSEDSKQLMTQKIIEKEALLASGLPVDVVDLVHGKPFAGLHKKNWLGFRTVAAWKSVARNADEIVVSHSASTRAADQIFDELRDTLQRSGMVRLTNTFSGSRFAFRLNKIGKVEYKALGRITR